VAKGGAPVIGEALVRLDGYLPIEWDGVAGCCQHLGRSELLADFPPGDAAQRLEASKGALPLLLRCSDALTVRARARLSDHPAFLGSDFVRFRLTIEDFDSGSGAALQAHLSSLRKAAHLGIASAHDVEAAQARSGFQRWRLPHVALPEGRPEDVDLSVSFLGKRLRAPVLIAGMTGGSERAAVVNRRLAALAQQRGFAFGLGSQRAMLEQPLLAPSYRVRDVAPDVLLLANIGAAQLKLGVGADECRRLVDEVSADALAIHLNVLQELVQPEGDRDWREILPRIATVAAALQVPVIVKETGCGISGEVALRLRDAGVAAVDVGGLGGTSWGWIEGFRSADPQRKAIGATFRDWGIPSAEAVLDCRRALGEGYPIVATGGLRSGLDAATALALGADVAGFALPFLRAADESEEAAAALGSRFVEELRIATFCAGARAVTGLRGLAREAR
jgi:isopentenyl-diphosphate delta-isomerase